MKNPFRYFNSSPEVIRLVVMLYVKYPLSLRNVEDLLAERGIDISYETVRFWWNRFGPMFAAEIRQKRIDTMKTLQKFSSVHASVHNHFNQDRHLISRENYKERRSAALAEWQAVMA